MYVDSSEIGVECTDGVENAQLQHVAAGRQRDVYLRFSKLRYGVTSAIEFNGGEH